MVGNINIGMAVGCENKEKVPNTVHSLSTAVLFSDWFIMLLLANCILCAFIANMQLAGITVNNCLQSQRRAVNRSTYSPTQSRSMRTSAHVLPLQNRARLF